MKRLLLSLALVLGFASHAHANPECYANDTSTTLSGTITNVQTTFTVASSTGFPSTATCQFRVKVDQEYMLVTTVSGNNWTVTRAVEGSSAAGHNSGAAVTQVVTVAGLLNSPGPDTTTGDIGYYGSGGAMSRLVAPSSDGKYVVNFASKIPSWVSFSSGGGYSQQDNTAYPQGNSGSLDNPAGCLYITSYTAPTSGNITIPQCDVNGDFLVNLMKVGGSAIALGQTTMGSSLPVTIASNQTAVPENLTQVNGSSVSLGQTTMANSIPVVIPSNQSAVPENITQVNGSTLSLGQATMANSVPVAIASNQGNVPINEAQINGVTTSMNNGTSDTGTQRVTLASNSTGQVALTADNAGSGTLQSAATGSGNGTDLTVTGYAVALVTINCSSCSGGTQVNFFVQEDGTNFIARDAHQVGTNTIANSTTTAGFSIWEMSVAGAQKLRASISAYSAGTVTVTAHVLATGSVNTVHNENIIGTVPVTACSSDCNVNIDKVGNTSVVADPCWSNTKSFVAITQTANTRLIVGTAAKKIYVCAINLVTATAQNIAVVEGTGSVCASSTAGVPGFGGATAATGWNFAANGGLTYGNGGSALGGEGANADDLCLFQSGAGQVSGGLSYVVQ